MGKPQETCCTGRGRKYRQVNVDHPDTAKSADLTAVTNPGFFGCRDTTGL